MFAGSPGKPAEASMHRMRGLPAFALPSLPSVVEAEAQLRPTPCYGAVARPWAQCIVWRLAGVSGAGGAKTASVVAWRRAAGADGGDGDSHGGGGGGGSTRTDTRDERSVPSGVASGNMAAAVGGRRSCMRVFQYYVMECRCCAYAKARLRVCRCRVAEPLGIRTRFGIRDQTRWGLDFERDCRTNYLNKDWNKSPTLLSLAI